jgi:hypothetical protein
MEWELVNNGKWNEEWNESDNDGMDWTRGKKNG